MGMRPRAWVLLACGAIAGATATGATGEPATGELVVVYAEDATPHQRARARDAAGVSRRARGGTSVELVRSAPGEAADAAAALRRQPGVQAVAPNVVFHGDRLPDDPLFPVQWGLRNVGQAFPTIAGPLLTGTAGADIDALGAWRRRTAGATIAIVDSGLALDHEDLACNLWTNPGESGVDADGASRRTNGIDDDGNGFVDDWRGWDFVAGDAVPADEGGHGSHVGGIAGACGDNATGIAGTAWRTRLMAVRSLDANITGTLFTITSGLDYAGRMGARVANASVTGPGNPAIRSTLAAIMARWPRTLYVLAAGNLGLDLDLAGPNAALPCQAAGDIPNAICVGATTADDAAAVFSNRGTAVEIGAPGEEILSVDPTQPGGYGVRSGTSMSAPHVAGVAALLAAARPPADAALLRRALIDGARVVPTLEGAFAGRRLDGAGALRALAGLPLGPAGITPPAHSRAGGGPG